ncbi:hypothetical protein ABFG93_22915 (plasmid) [Pseudalkalibacillus hwajinpoensis]|uniref:hypothetical protein n=1 Tax=Guptibacillus hwajinpoensis TaxID=208199 RepID=UPI00325AA8B3
MLTFQYLVEVENPNTPKNARGYYLWEVSIAVKDKEYRGKAVKIRDEYVEFTTTWQNIPEGKDALEYMLEIIERKTYKYK